VRILLAAGFNPKIQDADKSTALHEAVQGSLKSIVMPFIKEQRNVSTSNLFDHKPLHTPAGMGRNFNIMQAHNAL